MLSLVAVLWESLPLVKYVQFPWRFLALIVFGATICATALADRVAVKGERSAIITCLLGIVLLMAAYFAYYSEAYFFVGDGRTRSVAKLSPVGVRDLQAAGVLTPSASQCPPPNFERWMNEPQAAMISFPTR